MRPFVSVDLEVTGKTKALWCAASEVQNFQIKRNLVSVPKGLSNCKILMVAHCSSTGNSAQQQPNIVVELLWWEDLENHVCKIGSLCLPSITLSSIEKNWEPWATAFQARKPDGVVQWRVVHGWAKHWKNMFKCSKTILVALHGY